MKKKIYKAVAGLLLGSIILSSCSNANDGWDGKDYHEVTFKNYDATVLYFNTVKDGEDAVYQGETPVRPSTSDYRYVFTGWDKPLNNIRTDTTFVAQYDQLKNDYVITWKTFNGDVICHYQYGETPSFKGTLDCEDEMYYYVFTSWTPEIVEVTEDKTYVAQYNKIEKKGIFLTVNNVKEQFVMSKNDFEYYNRENFKVVFDKMFTSLVKHEVTSNDSYLKRQGIDINALKIKAENKVNEVKQEATSNAKEKGTTYDDELDIILDGYQVSDLDELLYSFAKQMVNEWYLEKHYDEMFDRYLNKDSDYFAAYPYYMKHVLVKMDLNNSDYLSHITSNGAGSLYNHAKAMINPKNTFSTIDSDDFAPNNVVGIMNKTSSFIYEFILGTYVFDSLFYHKNSTKVNEFKTSINLGSTNEGYFLQNGLDYVPYGVFTQLNEVKDLETRYSGEEIIDSKEEDYYPRNIYFNKYLNRHNPFLITNDSVATSSSSDLSIFKDKNGKDYSNTTYDPNIAAADANKMGFRYVKGLSRDNNHLILTDEKSNPIYCTRSDYGIHFIVMDSSPLDGGHIEFFKNLNNDDKEYIKYYISENYIEWDLDCFNEILDGEPSIAFAHYDQEYNLMESISILFDDMIQEKETYIKNMFSDSWYTYSILVSMMNTRRNMFPEESEVFNYIH